MEDLQDISASHLIAMKGMVTPGCQIFANNAAPESQTKGNLAFVVLSFCRG